MWTSADSSTEIVLSLASRTRIYGPKAVDLRFWNDVGFFSLVPNENIFLFEINSFLKFANNLWEKCEMFVFCFSVILFVCMQLNRFIDNFRILWPISARLNHGNRLITYQKYRAYAMYLKRYVMYISRVLRHIHL